MSKVIMVQGTMSNAGKSLVVAALCRILKEDGFSVCPFKSQNMALNSFITKEGFEMGRAQVMQAQAAGIEPDARMNPILLKPNSDTGSQVIVNGKPIGNMDAKIYYANKKQFVPMIQQAYDELAKLYDVIVIEGAGSPAEINLKENDIVNMGMAKIADAPVILVGDIDRGGVFAQLYGTVMLLDKEERQRIKGLVINKFRGDKTILDSGLEQIKQLTDIPVVGVLPYIHVDIEEEDSLSEKLSQGNRSNEWDKPMIDIAVISFPRMSNYTDFDILARTKGVIVRYVHNVQELKQPDMIILPGTKSTMSDLVWLKESGLFSLVQRMAQAGTLIFGICGGFQMLGEMLKDPEGVEYGGEMVGLSLLPITTSFEGEKCTTQTSGKIPKVDGMLWALSERYYEGYEIHHGKTYVSNESKEKEEPIAPLISNGKNVYGSYVHGLFDQAKICEDVLRAICEKKNIVFEELGAQIISQQDYREQQFDFLARHFRKHLDMKAIYEILDVSVRKEEPKDIVFEHVLPAEIETRSFEIIESELGNVSIPPFEKPIVKRAIHTTADFDYLKNLVFSEKVVEKALKALKNGACIVTDTTMAWSGIHKSTLHKLGGEAYCFIGDEDVANRAKEKGCTRSYAAVEKAMTIGKPIIFAIGNAPTALIRIQEMYKGGKLNPELVIGVPVGFVNVVQSKELIIESGMDYIVARGRKGGSNVAAAICNALLYMAAGER